MDPVGHLDVITVGREAHTREVLEDLWARAVHAVLDPGRCSDNGDWDGGSFSWSQGFGVANDASGIRGLADRWLTRHSGWLDLLLSPDDFWSDDRTGEPAFGAGVLFEHKKGRTIRTSSPIPLERSGERISARRGSRCSYLAGLHTSASTARATSPSS
jgi:hypothetical protein